MSNLEETTTYESGIYQIEATDAVLGGAEGIANLPHKKLANRTNYLKTEQDTIKTSISNINDILAILAVTDKTYYVDGSSGSDITGEGTSGSPWATIQHAIDSIPKIIAKDVTITIQVALGAYAENITIDDFRGGGTLVVEAEEYILDGAVTGGSATTVIDSTKSWTTDAWVGGYAWITTFAHVVSGIGGTETQIASNTGTTITGTGNFGTGSYSPASGDKYCVSNCEIGTGTSGNAFAINNCSCKIQINGFFSDCGNTFMYISDSHHVTFNACYCSGTAAAGAYNIKNSRAILNSCEINAAQGYAVIADTGSQVDMVYCGIWTGGAGSGDGVLRAQHHSTIYVNQLKIAYITGAETAIRCVRNGLIYLVGDKEINAPTSGYGIEASYCSSVVYFGGTPAFTGSGTTTSITNGGQIGTYS